MSEEDRRRFTQVGGYRQFTAETIQRHNLRGPAPGSAAMTDVWCFTCSHELRQEFSGKYAHLDQDDLSGCPCAADGEECQP